MRRRGGRRWYTYGDQGDIQKIYSPNWELNEYRCVCILCALPVFKNHPPFRMLGCCCCCCCCVCLTLVSYYFYIHYYCYCWVFVLFLFFFSFLISFCVCIVYLLPFYSHNPFVMHSHSSFVISPVFVRPPGS